MTINDWKLIMQYDTIKLNVNSFNIFDTVACLHAKNITDKQGKHHKRRCRWNHKGYNESKAYITKPIHENFKPQYLFDPVNVVYDLKQCYKRYVKNTSNKNWDFKDRK